MYKSQNHSKKGFTLVEITIVIGIIGALLALAVAGRGILDKFKLNKTDQTLAKIDLAIDEYHSIFGQYPTSLEGLVEAPTDPKMIRKWKGALAKESDFIDGFKRPIEYELYNKGSQPPYKLYAHSKDGQTEILSPASQE